MVKAKPKKKAGSKKKATPPAKKAPPGFLRRHWFLLALALAGLILAVLVYRPPVGWLAWAVQRSSHGTVELREATGTVWKGRAVVVLRKAWGLQGSGDRGEERLSRLAWEITPALAGGGSVGLDLYSWDGEVVGSGRLDLGYGTARLRGVDVYFPARFLPLFYPPAELFSLGGGLRLQAGDLEINRAGINGVADISWLHVTTPLSAVTPLGDYRLVFEGRHRNAVFRLETLAGPLAIQGHGRWQLEGGELDFNGKAEARERRAELEPLVQLLGRDQGNGQRLVMLHTQLVPQLDWREW